MQTQELAIFVYTCSPMQTVSVLPRFTYWSHYMDILNLVPQQKIASVSRFFILENRMRGKNKQEEGPHQGNCDAIKTSVISNDDDDDDDDDDDNDDQKL